MEAAKHSNGFCPPPLAPCPAACELTLQRVTVESQEEVCSKGGGLGRQAGL